MKDLKGGKTFATKKHMIVTRLHIARAYPLLYIVMGKCSKQSQLKH